MDGPYINSLLGLALAAGAWVAAPSVAAAPSELPPKSPVTITGRLAHQDRLPVLKAKDKIYRLVSSDSDSYSNAILHEERVVGREFQLEGRWKGSDTFQVDRLFTVRDGKLYKVVYFCDVCNITAYQPGRCDCCQQPTEVREVPRDPQGIH